jgi:hypothetical protein
MGLDPLSRQEFILSGADRIEWVLSPSLLRIRLLQRIWWHLHLGSERTLGESVSAALLRCVCSSRVDNVGLTQA